MSKTICVSYSPSRYITVQPHRKDTTKVDVIMHREGKEVRLALTKAQAVEFGGWLIHSFNAVPQD